MRLRRLTAIAVVTGAFVLGGASSAAAVDCFNTQKAAGSGGTVGTYDVATDVFTPSDAPGNPVFVEIVFPDGSSNFLFIHAASEVNGYVVPGAKDCDGKGLDNFESCFG